MDEEVYNGGLDSPGFSAQHFMFGSSTDPLSSTNNSVQPVAFSNYYSPSVAAFMALQVWI